MSTLLVGDTRHISLARVLHARLYVNCEGRVFVGSGQVAHEKLQPALAHHDCCPTVAAAPTLPDLGVPICDGELSSHSLHSIGRALRRWQMELAAEMQRSPARRRRTTLLASLQQETETLTARLAALRDWQSQLASGAEPAGAPFFLDSACELALQAALREFKHAGPLPPLIAWQARVVCWLSGEVAMRRYLAAITSLLSAYPKIARREQLRGFQRALIVWKKRGTEGPIRGLLAEMARHIGRLPKEIVQGAQLTIRLRGRTFPAHCDRLLRRCTELLAKQRLHRWNALPAALAALAAADASPAALPLRCFRECAETENFALLRQRFRQLGRLIGRPGYDALLAAIDQLPMPLQHYDYDVLRELLAQGNSWADVGWVCQAGLLRYVPGECLTIAATRRLSEDFDDRGCPLNNSQLATLVANIRRPQDLAPVRAWLAWLGTVSPRAITPRMRNILRVALLERYLPSAQQPGWFEQLAPCLAPPRWATSPDDCAPLLERIAEYQQLAGMRQPTRKSHVPNSRGPKSRVPKSLRKLLEFQDRRDRERDQLRARLAAGTLDAAAQARLHWLDNDNGARPQAAKIRRAAEEVFLLLGIEALTAVTHRLAEGKCRKHLGRLTSLLTRDQRWDFARWIDKMEPVQRRQLGAVVDARSQDGPQYKRHLADNKEWLSRAFIHGLDVGPWFAAQPHEQVIAGRPVEIVVASDLHDIFLMGTYFHTCLSQGGINEMSVLANAYDANKQVVFIFTTDHAGRRHAVARQLIAISSDFKLLGYFCYVGGHHADRSARQEYVNAMAAYCGRLAAACGLELTDQGSPEALNSLFWYDDGVSEWPSAARAAWAESSRQADNSHQAEAFATADC